MSAPMTELDKAHAHACEVAETVSTMLALHTDESRVLQAIHELQGAVLRVIELETAITAEALGQGTDP